METELSFVIEVHDVPYGKKNQKREVWAAYNPELGMENAAGIIGFGDTPHEAVYNLAFTLKRRKIELKKKNTLTYMPLEPY